MGVHLSLEEGEEGEEGGDNFRGSFLGMCCLRLLDCKRLIFAHLQTKTSLSNQKTALIHTLNKGHQRMCTTQIKFVACAL